jgi:YVTN family beta-propeller protein
VRRLSWVRRAVIAAACALGAMQPQLTQAAGPGLPNLSYGSGEVFQPLSIIKSAVGGNARGEGTVQMVDGYLFVPFGKDSGAAGGGFAFYDISNPRAPVKKSQKDVTALREPHGFGFTNAGRWAVMQSTTGIQFWDFTDVLTPTLMKSMTLPGIQESDYNLGAWWAFWQAPYVYVGGSGNGLLVVDASDPRNPVYVKTVPTSTWGGFRVGPVYAVGNLLVMTSTDGSGLVTMDISDPRNPKLLGSNSTAPGQYSGLLNGERLITAGTDNKLRVYDISDPTVFTETAVSVDVGGKGGYLSVQGGFAHAGFSTKYAKINLSTGNIAGTGSSKIAGRDEDFATVIGNLVLVGNDHGEGSALMPHQATPYTTAPAVNMVSPKNNASGVATSSRIGITLTSQIDLRTVDSSSFIVRPVGGSALTGRYSGQQGILNFAPDFPLNPGTTYEVVVSASGMRDDAGNAVTAFTSRFTTAGTVPLGCSLATRAAAAVGATLSFSPQGVSGSGLQYAWDFGDGNSTAFSTRADATHAYAAARHHAVVLRVRNGTQTGSCSTNQTVYNPPTASAPRHSSTLAYDAGRNRLWAVNSDAGTVSAINTSNNTLALEAVVGANPQAVAIAPNGRVWVANAGAGSVSVLDPASGALLQTINVGAGTEPFGVAFAPNGSAAYVTLQGSGRLLKLDPTLGTVQAQLDVGPTPRGIAISGDSTRVLITRYISPASKGEVVEVNAGATSVTRRMALATDPGPDTESSGRGVPNFITGIAIQPDGRRAWVPSKKDNTLRGNFRDGQALTFESTVRTIVSQIDLQTNAEVLASRIDLNDRDLANQVVFSPLGDYAFVSTQGTNLIEVVDAYTRQISTGIVDVGRAPRGMFISPTGRLYVQNFMSRSVAVYDVRGILDTTTNSATKLADITTVGSEPLSAQVLRGKQIFYNAADRRMNRDKYISCASCHQDGGHDGRVMDFTDRGEGLRNTTVLNGRRGVGHGRVHWSANFDEIQDFEHDIRGAFGGTGFMTDAQFNTGTRNQPLGNAKTGVSTDLDALAAYVSSLDKVGRSPFRNADGSLTASALAGQALFRGAAQCVQCHAGPDFTDSASGVLRDVGTIKTSSGKRLGAALTGIDTPTLKGVWNSAPYLHDGSAATLQDVLTTQNAGGRHGATSGLTAAQVQNLVDYLQQIDDASDNASPAGVVVSGLNVRDTANASGWAVLNNLQVGALQYGDRTYTLTSVPAALLGSTWIRSANNSRAYTGTPLVTFNIDRAADVHVAIDDRAAAPSWLAGWTNTGVKLINSETTARSFTLYRKNFPAGAVSLGPLNNSGVSMYNVIVK